MKRAIFIFSFLPAVLIAAGSVPAFEVTYEDEMQEYSWYAQPSVALGVMDGRSSIEVHPDTWGRMVFFTGEEPQVLQKRVKYRHQGYLPIVECSVARQQIQYKIEAFADTLTGKPEDELIMFMKLSATNQSNVPQTAIYWAGAIYNPRTLQRGYRVAQFSPDRSYEIRNCMAIENGGLLFMFDERDVDSAHATLDIPYTGPFGANDVYSTPMSPICIVKYVWRLEPGETKSTVLKAAANLLPLDSGVTETLAQADYQDHFASTIRFWENLLTSGTQYEIPHKKTLDTLKTAFIDQSIAREKQGERYAQFVSRIQYPRPFFRDGIFIMRIYDLFGLPQITRQNIDYIRGTRFSGNSVDIYKDVDAALNPPLDDTRDLSKYPQKLWRYCEHFLMTDSRTYAREILPEVKALVTWIEKSTASDPCGLIPACTLCDNEFVGVDVPGIDKNGHRTGDNFWGVAALRTARLMAERLGETELVQQVDRTMGRFHPALLAAIDQAMNKAGYVPGTLDHGTSNRGGGWGEDRDNILLVWPHEALDPQGRAVEETIQHMRLRYQYGVLGHYDGRDEATFPYRSIWMMEAMVIRGDQELVVEDLYGQLAHTGSTHGSYEVAWKPRYGIEQHGWFNANYVSLIRNMLVRESWDNRLHILSVVPAQWARKVGNKIGIQNALTFYGSVSFTETILEDGARITLDNTFKYAPESIVLHLPYFAIVSAVIVDGKPVTITNEQVHLPSDVQEIRLYWETKPHHTALTYKRYLKEFRRNLAAVRIPVRYFPDLNERKELWQQVAEQPWKVIGPFDDINGQGLETVYAPEKELDFAATYQGAKSRDISWQDKAYLPVEALATPAIRHPWYRCYHQTQNKYWGVDFSAVLEETGTAYACMRVGSPRQQSVIFSLGSDGPIAIWLNNRRVHSNKVYRGWQPISPDQDKVPVTLKKGWNTLLVKCCRGGTPWGFLLRVLDKDGNPIEGLQFSAEKAK